MKAIFLSHPPETPHRGASTISVLLETMRENSKLEIAGCDDTKSAGWGSLA